MSEGAQLLRILGRIRRRARGLAGLDGVVAGGAVGTAALTLATALSRARGASPDWRLGAAIVAVAAVVGAAVAAARRISLVRCARLLDAALDGALPSRDRALSALSFVELAGGAPPALFVRAAIADAVERAGRLAPSLVAPARRPRTLPLLAGGALALAIVGLVPSRAPGARRTPPESTTSGTAREPRLRIAASAIDAEREEARAVAAAADAAGDVRMARLASELRAALDALASGQLGQGEALDRLRELAASAREAAEDSERERAALKAAGQALEPTASTRPLGRALAADAPDATERALDALANKAAEGTDADRAALAHALEAAAAAASDAAAAGETAGPEGAPRRRLNRDRPNQGAAASVGANAARDGERRLERLHRGLNDAAAGCQGDAATCARKLRESGGDLPRLQKEAGQASERRRLETAVRQLRERLRRGELGEGRGQGERRFARAARGQQDDSSREPSGGESAEMSQGGGRGGDDPAMADAEGEGESGLEESGQPGQGGGQGQEGAGAATASGDEQSQRGQGAGIGNSPGGDPLGAGATPPTRGREREAHLRGTAGPTRSEVIESSAQRGFASGEYERVWGDYQGVVEESLAASAVPEGRRYLVRRYFQIIRPRAPAAHPRKP